MPSGDTTQEHLALPMASDGRAPAASSDAHLLREQVRLLYDHALLSQLVALLNAGILVAILWPVVGHARLLTWLACMVVLCGLRLHQSHAFARALPPPEQV